MLGTFGNVRFQLPAMVNVTFHRLPKLKVTQWKRLSPSTKGDAGH